LAKNEYVMRYDEVCAHFLYLIYKAVGIKMTDIWYTHTSKPVCEQEDATVLWSQGVHSERSYSK